MSLPTFEQIQQELTKRSSFEEVVVQNGDVLLFLSKWTKVWYDSSFSSFDRLYLLKLKNGIALLPFYRSNETSVAYLSQFRMMIPKDVPLLEQAKHLSLNQDVLKEIDFYIQTQRLRSLFKKENENK